jgi:hypothetical protein
MALRRTDDPRSSQLEEALRLPWAGFDGTIALIGLVATCNHVNELVWAQAGPIGFVARLICAIFDSVRPKERRDTRAALASSCETQP